MARGYLVSGTNTMKRKSSCSPTDHAELPLIGKECGPLLFRCSKWKRRVAAQITLMSSKGNTILLTSRRDWILSHHHQMSTLERTVEIIISKVWFCNGENQCPEWERDLLKVPQLFWKDEGKKPDCLAMNNFYINSKVYLSNWTQTDRFVHASLK